MTVSPSLNHIHQKMMTASLNHTTSEMDWNAEDKQQTFNKLRQWIEMWLTCKKLPEADQSKHTIFRLEKEG